MTSQKSQHIGTLSPEMALLGLLYAGPGHGYDLHRKVLADLGQVWHLSQSQAYAILKRLETRGDLQGEEMPQPRLPARQWLRLTGQGRLRFLDWLENPSGGSARAIRMEFITRLYFLARYFPERVEAAFARQRAEVETHLRRLEQARAALPPGQVYNRMSLDLRLRQLQSVLDWLESCQGDCWGGEP